MSRSIADMVVIITGASAGIGRALAVELSRRGARLTLAARRVDRLEALARELGGQCLCVGADVARPEDCQMIVDKTAERFGRVDTLVCNAGYGFLSSVAESTAEQMREIFQTNVFGTTDCIRAAIPIMQRQAPIDGCRGQVMIVSSVVARRGLPFFGAYSATKAAQLSLAEAMRVELQPQQIAVTTVLPGGTESDFGNVSASRSGGKRPQRIPGERRQSAQVVASKMRRAIEKPRPEVWPLASYRWLVGIGALAPKLVDRVMLRRSAQISGDI